MLNTLLILRFIAQHGGTKPLIELRVATCACNSFMLFKISKRPSSNLPKHDSRMLQTYLVEDKNILYYTPNFFLGNKRFD